MGQYQPSSTGVGASSCLPCDTGKYGVTAGVAACRPCGAGRFNALTGVGVQKPVVIRMRNLNATSVDVFAQTADSDGRAGLSAISYPAVTVSCLAVEQGVYTASAHGVNMEAVKFTTSTTDRSSASTSNLPGNYRSYGNTYTTPVVVGQVLTANDMQFQTFYGSVGHGL